MSGANMEPTLHLNEVSFLELKGNAFLFLPPLNKEVTPAIALFAHGYTSHKGSLLNWGSRLADMGVATVLFDLPGHYLGSFHTVPDFEIFKDHAHELFVDAYRKLRDLFVHHFPSEEERIEEKQFTLIFGGHSLGAFLSLKALGLPAFHAYKKLGIAVGLGMSHSQGDKNHIFETDFYRKTLQIRQQLVAPALRPENVFPWLKNEKENLKLSGETIYLLTGEDDVVSPPSQVQEFGQRLVEQKNQVIVEVARRLSHHQPELAISYLIKFLKEQGVLEVKH